MRLRLYNAQDGKCFYCGAPIKMSEAVKDHFVPKSMGGSNSIGNRVLACRVCDQIKADRLPTVEETERLRYLHNDAVKVKNKFHTSVGRKAIVGDYWPDGPSWVRRTT